MTTTPPSGPPARRTGSHTSLTHLTLAPLSTGRPLVDGSDDSSPSQSHTHTYASSSSPAPTDDDFISPAPTAPLQYQRQHQRYPSSYLAAKSVPTTPGILSRSHSPTRAPNGAGSKSYTHLSFALPPSSNPTSGATTPGSRTPAITDIDVSISSAVACTRRAQNREKIRKNTESSEWLYRHGLSLTDSAREGKGQTWLASRASSTSMALAKSEQGVRSPETGRASARHSRRTSRAGSRAGSRVNLASLAMTAGTAITTTASTPYHRPDVGDYFTSTAAPGVSGPDFVHEQDEDDEPASPLSAADEATESAAEKAHDDAEIARLARSSSEGFGLGGMVDRFVRWSLFDVGSGEGKREEEEEALRVEQQTRLKRVRDSQAELARLARAERVRMRSSEGGVKVEDGEGDGKEESSTWRDAAWLLEVAGRAIF